MKLPSLEEVKKHFENARVIKCACDGMNYDITKNIKRDVFKDSGNCLIELSDMIVALYFEGTYAEIVEYINPVKEITFTLDQIAEHGELMSEYAKDDTILIEKKQKTGWLLCTAPAFYLHTEYRKRPKVIIKNDLGEEFTELDKEEDLEAFYYDLKRMAVRKHNVNNGLTGFDDNYVTQLSKTHAGALKLAVKQLEDERSTNN